MTEPIVPLEARYGASAMSQARIYRLGGVESSSKDSIRKYVKDYLERTPVGAELHDGVILHLLSLHPQWAAKSEDMKCIRIATLSGPGWSNKGFLICGGQAEVDIGAKPVIDRLLPSGRLRSKNPRSEVKEMITKAARAAIDYQLKRVACPAGFEVDHEYPRTFDRLLFLFLKWWGRPLETIEVVDEPGRSVHPKFADITIDLHWCIFHQRFARLRPLPPMANRRAPRYPVDWSRLP